MRHPFIQFTAISLLALAACSESIETPLDLRQESEPAAETTDIITPAATQQDDSVYVSNFWAGEYPDGFAVAADDVTVNARSEMHEDVPQNVTCPLLKNANYHPWNFLRSQTDALEFKSIIQKTTITMTADLNIEASGETEEAAGPLTLKAGDTLTYLSYIGEGFFIAEYGDKEYSFQEAEFSDAATFEKSTVPDQQWVNVKCADEAGTRAWILRKDVIDQEGITGTQIAAYGETFDLDDTRMANAFSP